MTYRYTDPDGDRIEAVFVTDHPGREPVVGINISSNGYVTIGVHIPLGRVEELVAGIRDTARQAAGSAGGQKWQSEWDSRADGADVSDLIEITAAPTATQEQAR